MGFVNFSGFLSLCNPLKYKDLIFSMSHKIYYGNIIFISHLRRFCEVENKDKSGHSLPRTIVLCGLIPIWVLGNTIGHKSTGFIVYNVSKTEMSDSGLLKNILIPNKTKNVNSCCRLLTKHSTERWSVGLIPFHILQNPNKINSPTLMRGQTITDPRFAYSSFNMFQGGNISDFWSLRKRPRIVNNTDTGSHPIRRGLPVVFDNYRISKAGRVVNPYPINTARMGLSIAVHPSIQIVNSNKIANFYMNVGPQFPRFFFLSVIDAPAQQPRLPTNKSRRKEQNNKSDTVYGNSNDKIVIFEKGDDSKTEIKHALIAFGIGVVYVSMLALIGFGSAFIVIRALQRRLSVRDRGFFTKPINHKTPEKK